MASRRRGQPSGGVRRGRQGRHRLARKVSRNIYEGRPPRLEPPFVLVRIWYAVRRKTVMRMRGLEPPRGCPHTDLNRARLPIPPHPRAVRSVTGPTFGPIGRLRPYHEAPASPRPSSTRPHCSLVALLAAAGGASARSGSDGSESGLVEVVVTLPQPSLSQAILRDRVARGPRDDAPPSERPRAGERLVPAHARVGAADAEARIETSIPDAQVRWRYGVVLNGMAVVVPRSQLATLASLPGATVWPSVTYHSLGDRATTALLPPQLIGATTVWGPTLSTAGQGMKIGIIDDGIDQTHPYFDPTGFTYPAGFPKGNTAYTTPKVIVARAFAPASETWKYGNTPFDPQFSDHATHVAGIAAGDHGTIATAPTGRVTALRRRPRRVPRQLQGVDRPDEGLRPRRELARDRRRDRAGGEGRHGRDQPLARRARGGAQPRHRREGARRRRRRRRRPGRRRRERLRGHRARLRRQSGQRAAGDYRRGVEHGATRSQRSPPAGRPRSRSR